MQQEIIKDLAQTTVNQTHWMSTYHGLGTEDMTLVMTEDRNPRHIGKVVEKTAVLTCTEDAVNIVRTQLILKCRPTHSVCAGLVSKSHSRSGQVQLNSEHEFIQRVVINKSRTR